MERFDLDRLRPGSRDSFVLPVIRLPDGGDLNLPVLAAAGQSDGPTLTVLAGVHGDEYEGVRAIPQIFRALDLAELRGRLIAVPVCNVPAYRTATRSSPIDGLNLARVFPGDAHGTVTQRIAHTLTEQIIAPANLLIDLHSAGVAYSMPTLVGYPYADTPHGRASCAAALAFGCDVVWAHPPDPSAGGRTISAAEALGIPWIYTEAAGGGRTLPEDVECYRNGVLNVMRHLGMLPGQPVTQPLRCHLLGAGNTDAPIRVDTSGYFVSEVALLDTITTGQVLGHVLDFSGESIETIRAHADGRVVMLRGIPAVHAGDGAFLLSGELHEASGVE
jgi:predicted deacylase